MTVAYSGRVTRTADLLIDLYRFVEVLDRHLQQLDGPCDARVAFDATDLRERAISLIRQIDGNNRTQ